MRNHYFSLRFLLLALLLAAMPAAASAQYVGPGGEKKVDVSSIAQSAEDGAGVLLKGNITRKTGPERYVFSDGSASIALHVPDAYFPNVPVQSTTFVVVAGTLKRKLNKPPVIVARSVKIVDNARKWRINSRTRMKRYR